MFKKFFSLSVLLCISLLCKAADTMYFKETKIGGWSLKKDFLKELSTRFHNDVFIESGTSLGGTAKNAAGIFNNVYSIEFDENLYKKTAQELRGASNIKLYQGDSGQILQDILKEVKGRKLLFWLDGHYSGFGKKPNCNTPIKYELAAVKASGEQNAVILIDDICCFSPDTDFTPDIALGYPCVTELQELILDINATYEIIIYGDIMIAYPPQYSIELSPLIKAMTASRFFNKSGMPYQEVFEAEGIIATQTTPQELEALWSMCTYHFGWHRTYPYLWYSLALFAADRHAEAYDNLLHVLETGYTDWRIHYYITQAAYRCGKNFEPHMQEIFKRAIDTRVAEAFVTRLLIPF